MKKQNIYQLSHIAPLNPSLNFILSPDFFLNRIYVAIVCLHETLTCKSRRITRMNGTAKKLRCGKNAHSMLYVHNNKYSLRFLPHKHAACTRDIYLLVGKIYITQKIDTQCRLLFRRIFVCMSHRSSTKIIISFYSSLLCFDYMDPILSAMVTE